MAFTDGANELSPELARPGRGPDLFQRRSGAAGEAGGTGSGDRAALGSPRAVTHLEPNGTRRPVRDRLEPGLAVLAPRQHEGIEQRHNGAAGRVGAGNGPGPDPGHDRESALLSLAPPPPYSDSRVVLRDQLAGSLIHPPAVAADVFGQPRSSGPVPGMQTAVFGGTDRNAALAPWLHTYNHHRRHHALGGHPPISRCHQPHG